MTAPKSLIINSPSSRPALHWRDGPRAQLQLGSSGRARRATRSSTPATTRDAPSRWTWSNSIRARVDAWREADCPGVTTVTRSLLEHWYDASARQYPFYFCQLEAIETLIWWVEARRGLQAGHRHSGRRRRVGAALQQDGHRQPARPR